MQSTKERAMSKTAFFLPMLGAAILIAAGCGGSSAKSSSSGAPIKTITIDETQYSLSPGAVSVLQPGTYVLKAQNKGTIKHAIAIEGQGLDKDSATIGPGESTTLTVTITKPGNYELYCPVDGHKKLGMKGTLTLGSGGGGTTTGTTTQQTKGGYGY